MGRGLALFAVSMPLALAFAVNEAGCVNLIESNGSILGLSGGEPVDAALESQGDLTPCTEAGVLGGDCTSGAKKCGCAVVTGAVICYYADTVEAGAVDAGATGVCMPGPELESGHTWTELYTDYFSGHGRAACAGNGFCHGSISEPGASATGYVCPPDDKDTCYSTMKMAGFIAATTFEGTYLAEGLQSVACTGFCNMPLAPAEAYYFSQTDVDRISAWLAEGAPNN
jgi:hypothetical protein